MADLILEMKNITKRFYGIKALDNVNLRVEEGEIHALVGENGAGKSTLMNVLSGIHPYGSYEGQIFFMGKECMFNNIRDSEDMGIVIIHQELALVPFMTIGENIFLGNECGSLFKINWEETYSRAKKLLEIVGLQESPRTLIKDISVGKQQLVEIAKALSKNVKLLILDEPTASLNEADSRKLLDLLLEFKKKGLTSIIISHKLNEIEYVADKITIIRDGATIETLDKNKDKINEDRIIKCMVGREISDRFPKRQVNISEEISLEVRNWTVFHPIYEGRKVVDDVSFYIRKGEVVGIAGLMGAGRTELALSIFGKSYGSKITGSLLINGKKVRLNSPRMAIAHKLAYITEDRKGDGLILSAPIRVNTSLGKMKKVSRHNIIVNNLERKAANDYVEKLKTKCSSIEQEVGSLSGGNQQKVLVGKWMFTDPDIMILDEPTRGIDVGAKYEIYCIINSLVAEGKSILLISSELPELIGICDRIYIMNEGKMVGEVAKEKASQEYIMGQILKSSKGA
ncbi:sugar ABC transporter ATP-binding protein [Herbinix luporum]|uniref:sugar ABC transporter ATP-binding protein n=1 Tax=Herbinix luporum TaxID=1679721 RepID=UPI0017609F36|nr:sugar ABC transporter ATP-binding protein [Herbinix luporum]HHT57712.1 sugar ABC transporter ATP-binding protein [Herbinix luporum]